MTLQKLKLPIIGAVLFSLSFCLFTPTAIAFQAGDEPTAAKPDVPSTAEWISEKMVANLADAGDAGAALTTLLSDVDAEQHQRALRFLIENMQTPELERVIAADLIDEVALACRAREEMPWGNEIPDEIFYNDVLPGFNVDEPRENWRPMLYEHSREIVADCKTPAEAAQRLNEQLFAKLSVKYSTARQRANQAPMESIEQGLASCTGLSIMLADACRSVCVPARLAGIPSWPNKRGNHTWVEVWDGDWHFTGAAEPSDQGLNHAWFQGDAALAVKDSRLNAIYAISFQPTDIEFPLVWKNQSGAKIYAVNVTDRYAPQDNTEQDDDEAAETAEIVQTRIRIWNHDRSERVVADVSVTPTFDLEAVQSGSSTGDTADMNNLLSFDLAPTSHFRLTVTSADETFVYPIRTNAVSENGDGTQLIEIALPRPGGEELPDDQATILREAVAAYFSTEDVTLDESLDQMLRTHPDAVRKIVWETWLNSPLAMGRKDDYDKHEVTFNDHVSPYSVKEVGQRPETGWPLIIAMHGGGGAPQSVNDSQWEHMQIYYKDHPEVGGYKYLALRAPNNTWNGFYDDYVYPLIENLIRQMVVHGDVDPDRVMIMGYSHGGYGAFAIGPKIPYRFAAVHASAAAATEGQTSAKTLRNTRFTFMVGEKDTAYGRRERCEKFADQVAELQKNAAADCREFPVEFLYQPGYGHGGLPDRDIIPNLYGYKRNAVPSRLTWEQTDSVVDHFFWLTDDNPASGKIIDAEISGNRILLTVTGEADASAGISVHVDDRLIDSSKPVELEINGEQQEFDRSPSLESLCESLNETGDIALSFDRTLGGKK